MMKARCWLCLGPVLFCLLDGGLTLHGQSHAYWQGQFDQAEELNPFGLWPLRQSPLVFVFVMFCWMSIFCAALVSLPEHLARLLAFAVQVGHSFGAASWLARHGLFGWLAIVLVLFFSRFILHRTWKKYDCARLASRLS